MRWTYQEMILVLLSPPFASSSSSASIQQAKLSGRKGSSKRNNYSTDELGDSMVSSESIDIDLDDARRGKTAERRPLRQ